MSQAPVVAIVTTLRNADAVLDSFIRYHRRIGFAHLFLFFDDPLDAGIAVARRYDGVTATGSDAALRARWRDTRYARSRGGLAGVDSDVMTRQILNVEIAIGLALERRIDWLLHIDADELFHCAGATVPEHFGALSDRGIARMTYWNHEAVPEQADVVDYFREATLFRRNPSTWEGLRLRPGVRALLGSMPQLPPKFFHFYANGKSAARVIPELTAQSVHDFDVTHGAAVGQARSDPVILHYPCCGFEHFWRKYTTLGAFPDHWFGEVSIRERIGAFHLDARDVVLLGDVVAAHRFYRERMVIEDLALIERLLAAGLFLRFDRSAALLATDPG